MTESSIYGSTRELMTATDAIEKASGDVTFKRRSLLSRQRSCQSFEMGSRKIDQVSPQPKAAGCCCFCNNQTFLWQVLIYPSFLTHCFSRLALFVANFWENFPSNLVTSFALQWRNKVWHIWLGGKARTMCYFPVEKKTRFHKQSWSFRSTPKKIIHWAINSGLKKSFAQALIFWKATKESIKKKFFSRSDTFEGLSIEKKAKRSISRRLEHLLCTISNT